ncbi:phenylacetate--CoA ligase family protein [Nocardia bovistercoris]|uniref:Phenylacetate--CoA ligase family protein n=1 Tax=Nocardia bovistercoris TaxID=2785916 RepID=A0A931N3M4_9NOCA|nr:phenylacetate--CoA ligase family protein [Nocardia bovistercoris]MBH0780800.1 phenylacetate--CoA ligase family protein [Nocardia bovistercoris]
MAPDPYPHLLSLFRRTADTVPAYRAFLGDNGIDPSAITDPAAFATLPLTTKANYHRRYPLPQRCRDGRLTGCDLIAVSSGSTGIPTYWPRSAADEVAATARFRQVLVDGFRANERRTLAVVCFPLGTWVGGIYTLNCTARLASEFDITIVAPGNNKAEILRVVPELGEYFDQVVLFGYPPFLKDVIDSGARAGIDWPRLAVRMVLAGEVISEQWRDLLCARTGADPVRDIAALYGTADAGVLGNETPLSVAIRRFLADRPDLARTLFGSERLPTLLQYDPFDRYFETIDGTLVFTADSGVPLIRYHIADDGGTLTNEHLLETCRAEGFEPVDGPELPFVYVFGRSLHAVSLYGANVFPETVTIGLEQPPASAWVTGKFVLEVPEDADGDVRLRVTVELVPDHIATPDDASAVAEVIRDELVRRNSEYANYVPRERHLPEIRLLPVGDPDYFPVGVKHRYTR